MAELLSLGTKTRNLNASLILQKVLEETETKEFLLKLNTKSQLFDKGINSEGASLKSIGGDYSPLTKKIKLSKGQPTNRVTLRDTGDFYNSGKVKVSGNSVTLSFDSVKGGVDLTKRWGEKIIGLTDESKRKAEKYILRKVLVIVLQIFMG